MICDITNSLIIILVQYPAPAGETRSPGTHCELIWMSQKKHGRLITDVWWSVGRRCCLSQKRLILIGLVQIALSQLHNPGRCSTWPCQMRFAPDCCTPTHPHVISSVPLIITHTHTSTNRQAKAVTWWPSWPFFFNFSLHKEHLTLLPTPLYVSSSPPTLLHGEGKGGRSHSELRGRALLSALRQETACKRAARHHTEALLKIHVYRSSSFIDAPSSLYVYEVRCLPVAPASDPPGSAAVSKKLPVPFWFIPLSKGTRSRTHFHVFVEDHLYIVNRWCVQNRSLSRRRSSFVARPLPSDD